MTATRRVTAQAIIVALMGGVSLSTPRRAEAGPTPFPPCNQFCWYSCSDYGMSGCTAAGGCSGAWGATCGELPCSKFGLTTIFCWQL